MLNPKNVQQAVRVALALANPTLQDKDWAQLKARFQLDDNLISGIKTLTEACKDKEKDSPYLKTILACLTYEPPVAR